MDKVKGQEGEKVKVKGQGQEGEKVKVKGQGQEGEKVKVKGQGQEGEKVKVKGQGQEGTVSSCASLTGGTRSVASDKAGGRKTEKSFLRLRLHTSTCAALALALAAFAANAGGLRHGLALRGAATGGEAKYEIGDYAADPAMMWDAEASAFTSTRWKNYLDAAYYTMEKNGGSASAAVRGEKYVAVGAEGGRYMMSVAPAYADALFRGEGLTLEYCYTQTATVADTIAFDYATAAYATEGVAYSEFEIQSGAEVVKYRLDATKAERDGYLYHVSAAAAGAFRTAAVVREGNVVRCYLNGEEVGQFTKETRAGSSYLYIGNGSVANFARVHCVRVYGRALTDAEIRKQWKVDRARFE